MATTELNFGPEWIRALTDGAGIGSTNSGGGGSNNSSNSGNSGPKTFSGSSGPSSSSSNSLSTTNNTFKSASSKMFNTKSISKHHHQHHHHHDIKYRYTKEEMLSYFQQSSFLAPPKDLIQHDEVYVDDGQHPLALIELTNDEIDLMSQNINPDFVLKKSMPNESSSVINNSNNQQNNHSSGSTTTMSNNNQQQQHHGSSYKDRISKLSSSDLLRSPGGGSKLVSSSPSSSNGFITERNNTTNNTNSYPTRGGGGGSSRGSSLNNNRIGRGAGNIVFTRLSSMDSSTSNSDNNNSSAVGGIRSIGALYAGSKKYIELAASGTQRDDDNDKTLLNNTKNNSGSSSMDSSSTDNNNSSAGGAIRSIGTFYVGSKKYVELAATGTQRDDNESTLVNNLKNNNSNSSSNSSSSASLFMPSWRSSTSKTESGTNSNNPEASSTTTTTVKESVSSSWKTNSWRINDNNGNGSRSSVPIRQKDFFGDPIIDDHHDNGISRIKQSTTNNSKSGSGKPFQKRSSFTSSERDRHHLSSFPSVDGSTMLDAERDLFGGRSSSSSSATTTNAGTGSTYSDLFSRNSSSTTTPKGLNSRDRYRGGDHRGCDENNQTNSTKTMDNSKFSHYSSSSKGSGYYGRSYDRFNSRLRSGGGDGNHYHHSNDDSDFFSDRFGTRSNNSGHPHHSQQQQHHQQQQNLSNDDDGDSYRRKDSLPEWSLEDPSCIDVTRVGTFDASGAFHEALDDDLMTPLEVDNDDDGAKNNNDDQNDDEDFFGRKISKTKKNSDNKNHSTTSGKSTEVKSNEPDSNKSEIRPPSTISLSTTTTKTSSKPKPIDYFNDPSLSPNYQTKSDTKQQVLNVDDKTVSKNNDEDNRTTTSMDGNNNNNGSINKNYMMNDENIVGSGGQANSLMSMIAKRNNDSNNTGQSSNNESIGGCMDRNSVFNPTSSSSGNNSTFSFGGTTSFGPSSAMIEQQQQPASQPVIIGGPISNPRNTVAAHLLDSSSTDNILPGSPSRTVPFKSINRDQNPNNNERNSLFMHDENLLMNDSLKFSSLLNDFNFDFGTTASNSNTNNNSTTTTGTNDSADHQLFMRLASQQQHQQPPPSNNHPFNNQDLDHHQTFDNGSTNNLLNNLANDANGQQRFNIVPSKPKDLIDDPLQQHHHQTQSVSMSTNHTMIKWFYCDPQGQTQGPFTSQEMFEWYNGGYFNPDLLVKRASDSKFTKLGELIQALGGRCPFNLIPPTPSPISVGQPQPIQQPTSVSNNNIQTGRIVMAQQAPPPPPPPTQSIQQQQQPPSSIQHSNFPLRTNNNEALFFPVSSSSTTTSSINNQQQPHSAPIVPPSSMNQFLTSSPSTTQSSTTTIGGGVGHHRGPSIQPPPTQPQPSPSVISSSSTTAAAFQFDDNLMNSFNLFQNLSKNIDTNQLNDDTLLGADHLIEQLIQQQRNQQQQRHAPVNTNVGITQQIPPNHHQQQQHASSSTTTTLSDNHQMRLLLNHLIQQPPNQPQHYATTKDEFLALNTHQQREQYLLDRFEQFNLTSSTANNNLTSPMMKDQLRQVLNEQQQQYHPSHHHHQQQPIQQQQPPTSMGYHHHQHIDDDQLSTASSSGGGGGIIGTGRITAKKLSLDETSTMTANVANARQQMPQPQQQPQLLQRTQSYEPVNFIQQPPQQSIPNHSSYGSDSVVSHGQLSQPVEDPLQLLKKYAASGNENFVPGALSVTDVEEIQRREAEERYHHEQEQKRNQQQRLQQQIVKSDESTAIVMDKYQMMVDTTNDSVANEMEFIEVQRNKHRNQQKQQPNQKLQKIPSTTPCKQHEQTQSSPQPPTKTPPPLQQQPPTSVILPQMPQLPKKAVWGSQSVDNVETQQQPQPQLSIAEIQRLQEEKEKEERRIRQEQQMQMNAAAILAQQQQQRSMKWATQPWQEQQTPVQIKTLTEIQAEEAEKQAALLRQQQQQQQEAMEAAIRRRQDPHSQGVFTPLSVIVAKGSGNQQQPPPGVWNGSPKPVRSGAAWDSGIVADDESQNHPSSQMTAASSQQINYKAAVAAGQKPKIDSLALRQVLKTNPKVKDQSLMMFVRNEIDNPEELYRSSVELLNKHFDNIDAIGFLNIVKDLGSPAEVSEYCQSYLGSNNVSKSFVKFFITRKTYLIKLKQQLEQERNKQSQTVTKKISNWNNAQEHEERVINYKSALSANNNKTSIQSSSSGQSPSNSNGNNHSSAHIKPATLKAQIVNNLNNKSANKGNDDINLMTIQVESMEEFDKWCLDVLRQNFELTIDAETFIGFLKDIASPDEINDYVQTYLGSNKISRDFAKNFITKRSYLRNKARQIEPYEDMCGPAPALTPGGVDNNGFVTVSSSNKKKRSKNKQSTT